MPASRYVLPSRLFCGMLKFHGTGYTDDLIPREPGPVTSRSFFPISPYSRIIMINALMVYTSFLFYAERSKRYRVDWQGVGQLLKMRECCKSCRARRISPSGHVFAGPSKVSSKPSSGLSESPVRRSLHRNLSLATNGRMACSKICCALYGPMSFRRTDAESKLRAWRKRWRYCDRSIKCVQSGFDAIEFCFAYLM